jgi:transcription antitermination protein NusB
VKGERRLARELALQVLYEIDLVGHAPAIVLHSHVATLVDANPRVETYARSLVEGILSVVEQLDSYIQTHAPEWPLDQVAVIDRNLLRMALYEFTVGRVPVKVAINEAVELAKAYGADGTPRFVNGVLGALVPHLDEVARALDPDGKA